MPTAVSTPVLISGYIIEKTAKRLKNSFQKTLASIGADITVDQWIVLSLLHTDNGISQHEIAHHTSKDAPTITRIIDLLCKKSLTERRIDPNDRRKFNIHLTTQGHKKVTWLIPHVNEFRQSKYEGLSIDDLSNLERMLNVILSNVQTAE